MYWKIIRYIRNNQYPRGEEWGFFLPLFVSVLLILFSHGTIIFCQVVNDLDEINGDVRILGNQYSSYTYTISALDFNNNSTNDLFINSFNPNSILGFLDFQINETNQFIDLVTSPYNFNIQGSDSNRRLGWAVLAGDWNHDGMDDLAFSDPMANSSQSASGIVYILFGSPQWHQGMTVDLETEAADVTIFRGVPFEDIRLGMDLSCLDFNGDGIDDLAMGAEYGKDDAGLATGAVYILYGAENFSLPLSIDLFHDPIDLTIIGSTGGDNFGRAIDSGDVNDDGIDDLVVGAYEADSVVDKTGRVYTFWGSTDFPPHHTIFLSSTSADVTIKGTQWYGAFGIDVACGDFNGDVYDDIMGCTYSHNTGYQGVGAAYVIYGRHDFPPQTSIDLVTTPADITIYGEDVDAAGLGRRMDSGDADGDGIDDLLIAGRTCRDTPDRAAGVYYLLLGRRDFPDQYVIPLAEYEPTVKILGDDDGDLTAGGFCLIEDMDGDGINDICLGAAGADRQDIEDCGEIYIFYSDPPLNNPPRLVAGPGPHENNPPEVRLWDLFFIDTWVDRFNPYFYQGFGVNVGAGDLDGDGYDELLTGPGPGPNLSPMTAIYTEDGQRLAQFLAYGTRKYGVNISAGDIDGDGTDEIITGPGPGNVFGPHVRAWQWDGASAVTPIPQVSFLAYGTPRWGVNVAAGDIDGDNRDEIITGAGPGSVYGPHVRGWDAMTINGVVAIRKVSFLAYGTNKYGVNVACGDIDGDGIDEIVTGPGPGQMFGSHIRGWNYDGDLLTAIEGVNFFAYAHLEGEYGAVVTCGDVDNDRVAEILTTPGPHPDNPAYLKTWNYDGAELTLMENRSFMVFEEGDYKAGARIAFGNLYDEPEYLP